MPPEQDELQYLDEISPRRRALDRVGVRLLRAVEGTLGAHWLFLLNATLGLYGGLALLAPLLLAAGQNELGRSLFGAYSLACHQLPERSFFLAGHQVAYCQRDTAIYGVMFLAGLFYASRRRRVPPLAWRLYLLSCVPILIDGGTQLLGWRESTWELRTLTGALFGLATVFFLYPHLEQTIDELRGEPVATARGRYLGSR